MIPAYTPDQIATMAAAVGAALGGVITLLFGKPVVEGVSKILEGSHKRWIEKRRVRREEKAGELKRKALERARQEKQNDNAHKQLIAYLTSKLETLERAFERSQDDAHNCHTECASLRAENRGLRQDIDELKADSARKAERIERLETRLGGRNSDTFDRPHET